MASTNITLKERSTLVLDDFRGVDFSSSPLKVASNRAVDMENLINVDGVNQKRPGWECVLRLNDNINGIYHYTDNDEDTLIVYQRENLLAYDRRTLVRLGAYTAGSAEDRRCQFFYNKGRVFILCGDYIVYTGGGVFEPVDKSSVVYLPITTTGIIGTFGSESAILGTTEDKVNLLTKRRINRIIGHHTAPNAYAAMLRYCLDAKIVEDSDVEVRWYGRVYRNDTIENIKTKFPDKDYSAYTKTGKKYIVNDAGYIEYEISWSIGTAGKDRGVLINYGDGDGTGELVEKIVDVIFEADTEEDFTKKIRDCTIGTLFGTEGDTNRLFLTGSSAQKNGVYYSDFDNFLYFPDTNYVTVGSSEAYVTGFLRLLDNTMAVFKGKQRNDAAIYYLTGKQQNEYDSSGNLTGGRAVFTVAAGGIGERNASHHAAANLGGDSLMLSENGVYGITFTENVTTGARYAKERSFNINERLRKHGDLSNSAAIVYKNRYYLSVDGVCYVADPRFRFYRENDMDSSYNYEWWYWTNVDARCFCNVDGELWFGTSDGMVCRFKENSYTDDIFDTVSGTNFLIDVENERITYQATLDIEDGDTIVFNDTENFYARVADITNEEDGYFFRGTPEDIVKLREGETLYAGDIDDNGVAQVNSCTVTKIDLAECRVYLDDGITEMMYGIDFSLFRSLEDREMVVCEKGTDENGYPVFSLRYSETGDIADIASYEPDNNYSAVITHRKNVVSMWVSPYFDMGSSMHAKTLLRLTVSAAASVGEKLRFGYQTKQASGMLANKGTSYLAFDDLSFDDFSLDTSFADSYTVRVNVRNFNYIRFRFVSDSKSNCAVNSLTALYKINKINRGVR